MKHSSNVVAELTTLGPLVAATLLIASLAIAWVTEQYPLKAAHWDSPIYLIKSKGYHEGGYLQSLRDQAHNIHDDLMDGMPYEGGFWSFVRVGHIVLLGTIVDIVGTDERSIYILTWTYRVLFVVGLFFTVLLSTELILMFSPTTSETGLWLGTLVSLALYLLSPIASYMSGNLVSEVPAILLLSMSGWALVQALKKRSVLYAVCSGALAFSLYVVRMETIWFYVAFIALISLMGILDRSGRKMWWTGLFVTAFTATFLYLVYSAAFFPLTDPRLLPRYVEVVAEIHPAVKPVSTVSLIAVASGFLWVGTLLALTLVQSNKAVQVGFIWLGLMFVPAAVSILNGSSGGQTRTYTTFIPALFLLSTLGWSTLTLGATSARPNKKLISAGIVCIALFLIAQPFSYSLLRDLPGMWRLQYIREYLAPPVYEQVDYHLPELVRIHRFLDGINEPVVVVASPGMQGADHIMVIEYLTKPEAIGAAREQQHGATREDTELDTLKVFLAGDHEDAASIISRLTTDRRVFLVSKMTEQSWLMAFSCCGKVENILSTDHFSLKEIISKL